MPELDGFSTLRQLRRKDKRTPVPGRGRYSGSSPGRRKGHTPWGAFPPAPRPPREKLLSDVWGYDFYGDERTLDTHIKLLRKSLGPYSGRIVTLRGVGYRFEG